MLILANNTQAYFREALDAAVRQLNMSISEPAQVYVVHLLNEFARTEKAFAGTDHGEPIVLVELLERAASSGDDREALNIYRHLGDITLYMLGFFKEAKERKIVSLNYYNDMGAMAYGNAACLSRAYTAKSAALFQELSENFVDMVLVLERVAKHGQAGLESGGFLD